MIRLVVGMLSVVVMALCASPLFAQDYPNKIIRIFTGSAGSGSDFASRLIGQGISGPFAQPVIVENRGGGGSLLAIESVGKASPDGHSLLVSGDNVFIGPLLRKVFYDPVRDLSPITQVSKEVNVLVVHPSLPAKSVKELIDLAKARPGELNYSSGGTGGQGHLSGLLFTSLGGVNIVRIPYASNSTEMADLIGGRVGLAFPARNDAMPYVKLGKLRALGITSAEPSALYPGLPTIAASGVPGYESVGTTGLWATAKTPVAVINRLNQEIVRLLNRADVKEKFFETGAEVVGSSPEQFAAMMKSKTAQLRKLIDDAGIKPE